MDGFRMDEVGGCAGARCLFPRQWVGNALKTHPAIPGGVHTTGTFNISPFFVAGQNPSKAGSHKCSTTLVAYRPARRRGCHNH